MSQATSCGVSIVKLRLGNLFSYVLIPNGFTSSFWRIVTVPCLIVGESGLKLHFLTKVNTHFTLLGTTFIRVYKKDLQWFRQILLSDLYLDLSTITYGGVQLCNFYSSLITSFKWKSLQSSCSFLLFRSRHWHFLQYKFLFYKREEK